MTSIDGGNIPKITSLDSMNIKLDETRPSSSSFSFSQSSMMSESSFYDCNRLRLYSTSMSDELDVDYADQVKEDSSKSLKDKMKAFGRGALSLLKGTVKQLGTFFTINIYRIVKNYNEKQMRKHEAAFAIQFASKTFDPKMEAANVVDKGKLAPNAVHGQDAFEQAFKKIGRGDLNSNPPKAKDLENVIMDDVINNLKQEFQSEGADNKPVKDDVHDEVVDVEGDETGALTADDQIEIVKKIEMEYIKKSEGQSSVNKKVEEGDKVFSDNLNQTELDMDKLNDEILNEMADESAKKN